MNCGGFSDEKKADKISNEVIDNVKDKLQYNVLNVISYKTQVVNGINYLLKCNIDNELNYILKIHKSLSNEYIILEEDLKKDF